MIAGKAQIEQDVYDVAAPFFDGKISGEVYPSDTRPRDSKSEDVVIVASTPSSAQFQEGRVRILVYVPDIDNGSGRPVPDIERIQEIEQLAEPLLDILNESAQLREYAFDFFTAPDRGGDPATSEHFVNIYFKFKRQTF
jgi:hypothetical protein